MSNTSRPQRTAPAAAITAEAKAIAEAKALTEARQLVTADLMSVIDVVKLGRRAIYNTADKLLKFDGQYKMAVKVLSPDKMKVIGIHFQAIKGFGEKPDSTVKRGSEAV